jgi:FMN-dependent NADH-azoreductase
VQLKNWIDAIARAGVTFRYTENGPEGLLRARRSTWPSRAAASTATPRPTRRCPTFSQVLGFLGMTDVRFLYAEGMAMGPDAVAKGFERAYADLEAALA